MPANLYYHPKILILLCYKLIKFYFLILHRYPYEYEGGHIKGAINLYTQEQIKKELIDNRRPAQAAVSSDPADKRDILVFHCEFSSERGPKL
jgi:M-phase inducer phosphatase